MKTGIGRISIMAMLCAAATTLGGAGAWATDGYFQPGYGARQKALGGAGGTRGTVDVLARELRSALGS